jgi:hypothetical protein
VALFRLRPIGVRVCASTLTLGGFEEWGSCPDDPLSSAVATELVTRLWRSGGSQAALLPAAAGAVNALHEQPQRGEGDVGDGGGGDGGGGDGDAGAGESAWPFIVPGLTPGERAEAAVQAAQAKLGKWKSAPSATVAGNCQPPDLGPQGQRPGANEACGVTTHNSPVVSIVMQYFRRWGWVKLKPVDPHVSTGCLRGVYADYTWCLRGVDVSNPVDPQLETRLVWFHPSNL